MKKPHTPKINSIHFAFPWLGSGITIGIIIPFIGYLCTHSIWWPLCVVGGIILGAFIIVFAIEMHQDFGKQPYYQKHLAEAIPFDQATQIPVLKCSICNGEQVAGFKNKADGSFVEVMLIRTPEDLEYFKMTYQVDEIKKVY